MDGTRLSRRITGYEHLEAGLTLESAITADAGRPL